MQILNEVGFDLMAEGIFEREIQLVVTCVKQLLRSEDRRLFCSVLADLEQLLWIFVFSGKIKLRES